MPNVLSELHLWFWGVISSPEHIICFLSPWFLPVFLTLATPAAASWAGLGTEKRLVERAGSFWNFSGISGPHGISSSCPCNLLATLAVERHHLSFRGFNCASISDLWLVQLPLEGDRIHTLTWSVGMTARDFPLLSWWNLKRNTRETKRAFSA